MHIGIECRLSLLETAVGAHTHTYNARIHTTRAHTHSGDLRKILLGFNKAQQIATPYPKLMEMLAEFDSIAGSLDQKVFSAFDKLDLLSPAARNLALQVADKRKKRRADDDANEAAAEAAVPPGSSSNRAGACQCRKSVGRKTQVCIVRCPCERAGEQCSSLCLCGEDCDNVYY